MRDFFNRKAPPFKRLPAGLALAAFLVVGAAAGLSFLAGQPGGQTRQASVAQTVSQQAGWKVDPEKSRLGIQIIQMGKPVDGAFNTWTASIDFDPDKPEQAKIAVDVDVASIALGGVSGQALGEDFLNAAAHPMARFVTRSVVATGPGTYEAQATLSLAGQTAEITLPFTLNVEANRAFVEGEVALERLTFGVGKKGFPGNSPLGLQVLVKVTLEADKLPTP